VGGPPVVLQRRFVPPAPLPFLARLTEWQCVGIVLLAAFLVRIVFLGRVPNSVTADELDFASNALEVMAGQGPGLFGLDWTPEPALGLHFIVGSWALFGETVFAERLVAAVLTALAVIPFYALMRRLVSRRAALLATLLFASARWLLLFSRSGWNNGDVVLFLLLAAWSLTLALERKQLRYWLGLGAAWALLQYGYFAGRAVVVAFAAYLLLHGLACWRDRNWLGLRQVGYGTVIAALTCAILFLPEVPTIVHDWRLFNERTAAVYVFAQPLPATETPATLLAGKAWTAARSFLFMDPTVNTAPAPGISPQDARYLPPGSSWLDPVAASLYVVGLVIGWRRRQALALWWCLLLIPLALTQLLSTGTPDGARALPAVAPMYLFVGLTIDAGAKVWAARRPAVWRLLALAAILVAVFNVGSYVRWVDSPPEVQARQPGIPVSGFATWRDFQVARLKAGLGVMTAGDYDQLTSAAIAAQIAGVPTPPGPATANTGLPLSPPVNGAPQSDMARQIATIGTPGDGPGDLSQPRDVAIDALGNLYVADSARKVIVVYAPDGHELREWSPASAGQGFTPWAIVAAPDGTLFVLDSASGRVGHFDAQGGLLGMVALPNPVVSSRGLNLGRDGLLYLAQTPANRVVRLSGAGLPLSPFGAANSFDQPTSALATTNGAIFVYEPDSGRLQLQAPDGHLLFTLPAPHADTVNAGRLAVLSDGRVLLGDASGHRIVVYAADGRLLGSFPVAGLPQGLAAGPTGTIAVADLESQIVRVYALGR
jgi:4-amino-4-deoxy-L-arabinose transferase-like glycosyltransferase/streptogramin lyase